MYKLAVKKHLLVVEIVKRIRKSRNNKVKEMYEMSIAFPLL